VHRTCGACTVLVEGRPIYSCLALAIDYEGKSVETIEGLESDGQLHPIQQAFIEEDGFQCGFCTPGQVLSAKALLDKNPSPRPEEVQEAMAGNLCRCGAYPKILKATLRAAERIRQGGRDGPGQESQTEFEGRITEESIVVEGRG
jgi:aerobic-type carbon monoxide dehydrogenase small subunit (CoxS/CutS family)